MEILIEVLNVGGVEVCMPYKVRPSKFLFLFLDFFSCSFYSFFPFIFFSCMLFLVRFKDRHKRLKDGGKYICINKEWNEK
jgi:hypothetical protein